MSGIRFPNKNHPIPMSRNLYSPRLSDDVVRALYREGRRRRIPMTRLADDLLRRSLASSVTETSIPHLCEDEPARSPIREPGAA